MVCVAGLTASAEGPGPTGADPTSADPNARGPASILRTAGPRPSARYRGTARRACAKRRGATGCLAVATAAAASATRLASSESEMRIRVDTAGPPLVGRSVVRDDRLRALHQPGKPVFAVI